MGAAGVERIVYLGALGVRDDPRRHLARSKALADEAVRVSGLHRTVLRPSHMWGERDGFVNIVTSLARPSVGVIAVPARQSSLFRPFWVGDLATMVTMTLAEPSTGGRVFELGGPEHWTYREVVDEVLRATGRRRLVLPVPLPLIRFVAGSAEVLRLPFPVAGDQLRQLAYDNAAGLDDVERAFGFVSRSMRGRLGYLVRRRAEQ